MFKIRMFGLIFLFTVFTGLYGQGYSWQEIGEMPTPVVGGKAVVQNSKIYIVGGDSSNGLAPIPDIQEFDPATGQWRLAGKMQTGRSGFVADFSGDSLIICGGIIGRNEYDGASLEVWRGTKSFIIDRNIYMDRVFATGGIFRGELYLFGGYRNQTDFTDFPYLMVYDIIQKKIVMTDSIFPEVPWHQFSAYYKDTYYIFGGTYFGVSRRIYRFNINTRIFERIMFPEMFEARAGAQAVCTPKGDIYIIGGYNETNDALVSTEIFRIYDVGFSIEPDLQLNYARKGLMAVYFDNAIYVFGGRDENDNIVASVEMLELVNNTNVYVKKEPGETDFRLEQNYPNPFNAGTTICFTLNKRSKTLLEIYNVRGERVKLLVNATLNPGHFQYIWDGRGEGGEHLPSDIYLFKLSTAGYFEYKKMILIK
ncbi:T9SS type A sorting domain-containing protein [candidate division KSB1 bacterium]|nr:T9SS type A sorting domain-containing protein [candidate division KSB1 bacterium]